MCSDASVGAFCFGIATAICIAATYVASSAAIVTAGVCDNTAALLSLPVCLLELQRGKRATK